MKILLTGAAGYIGKNIIPALLADGHHVVCCVRDRLRMDVSKYQSPHIEVIEVDFLKKNSLVSIPADIDAAYYLIHSMSSAIDSFESIEKEAAMNFREAMLQTTVKQVVYLSGIVKSPDLSKHLKSRKAVEDVLREGPYHLTVLGAGIIVGAGSASFEIMRDLVEKLPVMIAPKWLNTRSQPIAIKNVVEFLMGVLMYQPAFDRRFEIGGPEILTYREMLLKLAEVRHLKRWIFVVPVFSPKLSSYWLYFITSTAYKLAVNLVDSMKVEMVAEENNLDELLNIRLTKYQEAVRVAFEKVEKPAILPSWTDALSGKALEQGISRLINVPTYGCYIDRRSIKITDEEKVLDRVWSIGGETGWYFANWLWKLRGFIDKLFGGVGLRRGRKSITDLMAGDSLDFWRVLLADRAGKRLLLYAEMKIPGEAWLEFEIREGRLHQNATFRPHGLPGRAYWFGVAPLHIFIFGGMIRRIAKT